MSEHDPAPDLREALRNVLHVASHAKAADLCDGDWAWLTEAERVLAVVPHRPADPSNPVDAAWEAFVTDLHLDDADYDATVDRHRPLIESALAPDRSHAWSICVVCGASGDDPEAAEPCEAKP